MVLITKFDFNLLFLNQFYYYFQCKLLNGVKIKSDIGQQE